MKKKKYSLPVMIISLMLVLCVITVFATTATVDDKRGEENSVLNLCNIEGCNAVGEHQHGNVHYSGHSINDGHNYHANCNEEGCTEIIKHDHQSASSNNSSNTILDLCNIAGCNTVGEHQHGNEHYSGHSINDGHNYHANCNAEGCTEITKHDHQSVGSINGNKHHDSGHDRGRHH